MEQYQEICQVIFSKIRQLSSVVKESEVVRLPRFLRTSAHISQTCSNEHFDIETNMVMISVKNISSQVPRQGLLYSFSYICFFLNLQVVVLLFAIHVVKDYQTKLQQVKHKLSSQSQKKH